MKSLVIYDSKFGNTKAIAEAIAQVIEGEARPVDMVSKAMLKDVELLIVGSPINAWRPTIKMKNFLNSLEAGDLAGVKAAAFDTRVKIFISGNAAKRISKSMGEKGTTIVAEPKAFYVKDSEGPLLEGELENAKSWAREIIKKVK